MFDLVSLCKNLIKFGKQIGKIFAQELTCPKENYRILRIGVMRRCQKGPKFDFQSRFSMSKMIGIFLKNFSLKNTNLGAHFFVIDIC